MSERKYQGPWRVGAGALTEDYPGLWVGDGAESRVTGSITDGQSRLPLWALMYTLARAGWEEVATDYPPHEMDAEKLGRFLHSLLNQRGEFGRLVCALADVERRETTSRAWWETKTQRRRMIAQLQRCIDALQEEESA